MATSKRGGRSSSADINGRVNPTLPPRFGCVELFLHRFKGE